MNKGTETATKVLAGLGALNIGLSKFVGIDILGYVPVGIIKTIVVAAVGISGAVILYWVYQKKI